MSEENTEATIETAQKKETPERQSNEIFGAGPMIQKPEEIPFENVPLASNGIIYPPDSPLHNREEIEIKVMTAAEEDILTSPSLLKSGKVIEVLLESCIMDKSIKVNDMIAGDRNAVMVSLRITGYGAEYPGMVTCTQCEADYEHVFNLLELEIKRLEIEPVEPGMNLFRFTLPNSKSEVLFKFLTGHDEVEMDKAHENRKKKGIPGDNRVTERLRYSIVEIDGSQNKGDIVRAIQRMRAMDSLALRRYMTKNEPGIEMKAETTCPNCGNTSDTAVPIGPAFFFPAFND